MAGNGQVWVPVNAQMKGFVADVIKSASGAASKGSKAMSDEFGAGGRSAGKAAADGLASQASQIEKISTKLGQARKAEAVAAADVISAEAKLESLRKSGQASASQLARAEQVLETAKNKQADAGTRVARAEQDISAVREGGRATAVSLARAEDMLATAKTNAGTALAKARTAELQIDEARAKSKERAKQVADAEQRLMDARDLYGASTKETAKAERDLEAAKKQSIAADQRVADAVGRGAKARAELASANDQVRAKSLRLKATTDDLARSEEQAAEATRKVGRESAQSEGGLSKMAEAAKGAAFQLGALVGAGASISSGWAVSREVANVNNQLGFTGETAQLVGSEIGQVLRGGVAGDAHEAATAVGSLQSQFGYLGYEGEQTAAQLSDNFLAFTRTFEVDMAEATQTAGQLVKNGLATDVEDAADLMVTSMQRVPAQMRGELPEIINEYGTNFRALGFSGQEAFGMLVTQAQNGKWALDKTGDALKEFTIRGSDMSTASVTAFQDVGLNAEDMSNKIAQGGAPARDALDQTAQAILGIEDPAKRANTAIALFGTPLEDLSVDQIPQFLQGLSNAGTEMQGFQGSSQELSDTVAGSLDGRLNMLKGTAQDLAGKGFMFLWDAVQPVTQWAKDNGTWLGPLVGGLGSLAAIIGGITLATKTYTAVTGTWNAITTAATAANKSLTAAILTNPMTWLAAALVGVVVGLTLFFTKTETGKKIWSGFMDTLRGAWTWLKDTLAPVFSWIGDQAVNAWNMIKTGWDFLYNGMQTAWTGFIKPVLDGFMLGAKALATAVLTILVTPVYLAWQMLSAVFMWGWNNLIKPAWDAMKAGAMFLWNGVLMPVFGWIQAGWQMLLSGMKFMWESVLKPTWDAIQFAANWLWMNVLMPVFGFIRAGWGALLNGMKFVWDTILKPTFDAISAGVNWLWTNVFSPILGWIGDRWRDMGTGIQWVKDNVIQPVFDGLGSALDTLKGWFRTAVDAIGKTWETIKDKTSAPIRWVVDTVYNEGIKKIWDNIANFIGLEPLPKVDLAFASGGVMPGYTPGKDVHHFSSPTGGNLHLSGGEAIMRPEWTRAVGGPRAVDQMNAAARSGNLNSPSRDNQKIAQEHRHASGGVMRFAEGGVVGAMEDIIGQKYPMLVPVFSGYRPGGGNHEAGLAGDFSNGTGNTPEMIALANDIADTYPGSLELIHEYPGFDRQIKNGQFVGGGGGSWGFYAGAGPHDNHVHWAMDTPPTLPFGGGVFEGGSSSGGANGGGGMLRNTIRKIWDGIINPIKENIPEYPGMVGGIPKNAFETITDKTWNWISSKIPGGGSSGEAGPYNGGGAEQWRGLAREALQRHGYNPDDYIDITLQQIDIESGGDPNIINGWDSNAAAGNPSGGLLQVIPTTFDSMYNSYPNAFAGLPRNHLDPLANLTAGVAWTKHTYGGPGNIWPTRGGYDSGGWLQPGVTQAHNESGKPEPVFSHSQWQVLKGNISFNGDVNAAAERMIVAAETFANGVEKANTDAAKSADTSTEGAAAAAAGSTSATSSSSSTTTTSTTGGDAQPQFDVRGTMKTAGEGMLKGQFDDVMGVFGAPTEMPGWFNAGQDLFGQLSPAGIAAGKAALNAAAPGPVGMAGSAILDTLAPLAQGKDPEPADTSAAAVVPADATAGAGDVSAPDSTTKTQPVSTQTAGDGTTYQIVVQSMGQAYEAVKHLQARELAGFGAHR